MPQFSPSPVAISHDDTQWAARHMPLLATTMQIHASVFTGRRIGICLHIEPKTAVLVSHLAQAGAHVTLTGSPGTTQEATAAALRDAGVHVIGHRSDSLEQHRDNIARVLDSEPDLILDNGGDLIEGVLARGGPPSLMGATEETTTGGLRIRSWDTQPDFPVVVINDSRLKLLVENEYGVGQSVVQGFMNATNLMLPGARATVVGYGPCGKGWQTPSPNSAPASRWPTSTRTARSRPSWQGMRWERCAISCPRPGYCSSPLGTPVSSAQQNWTFSRTAR